MPYLYPPGNEQYGFRSAFASAALVNFTIDDTSSLITYSPSNQWRASTTPCSTCLEPDAQLAYAGTWHDGTSTAPSDNSASVRQDEARALEVGDVANANGSPGTDGIAKLGRRALDIPRSNAAKNQRRSNQIRDTVPVFAEKQHSEDAVIVDQPLSAAFNFTGASLLVLYSFTSQFCRNLVYQWALKWVDSS